MTPLRASKRNLRLLRLICCFFAVSVYADTNSLNEVTTNGIYASADISEHYPGAPHYVTITMRFTSPNTNVQVFRFGKEGERGLFFRPTNSVCGPMKLEGPEGQEIALLNPSINDVASYPLSYNLRQVRAALEPMVGKGPPLPYVISGDVARFSFSLANFFPLKAPGQYQFTIWPKIYKRTTPDSEICNRIDLPPVTLKILLKP